MSAEREIQALNEEVIDDGIVTPPPPEPFLQAEASTSSTRPPYSRPPDDPPLLPPLKKARKSKKTTDTTISPPVASSSSLTISPLPRIGGPRGSRISPEVKLFMMRLIDSGKVTIEDCCNAAGYSIRYGKSWRKEWVRNNGKFLESEEPPAKIGRPKGLSDEALGIVRGWALETPRITSSQLNARLREANLASVTDSTLCRRLTQSGLYNGRVADEKGRMVVCHWFDRKKHPTGGAGRKLKRQKEKEEAAAAARALTQGNGASASGSGSSAMMVSGGQGSSNGDAHDQDNATNSMANGQQHANQFATSMEMATMLPYDHT